MSLVEEYPRMRRDCTTTLRALFESVPGLGPIECEGYAQAINDIADKAHDLDEIFRRLVEGHSHPTERGELLIAFELTIEQIRGASDVINGKLYEVGDRLKESSSNGNASASESILKTS